MLQNETSRRFCEGIVDYDQYQVAALLDELSDGAEYLIWKIDHSGYRLPKYDHADLFEEFVKFRKAKQEAEQGGGKE